MTTRVLNWLGWSLAAVMLAGCASGGARAPVTERGSSEKKSPVPIAETVTTVSHINKSVRPENDWRPQTYVVQKGDTLYGIAFNYGLDYHELAEINNIQNPSVIQAGQELRLFPAGAAGGGRTTETPLAGAAAAPKAAVIVDEQPRVAKLPYSEQALADIRKMQETPSQPAPAGTARVESVPLAPAAPKLALKAAPVVESKAVLTAAAKSIQPEVKPAAKPEAKAEVKPASKPVAADVAGGDDAVDWSMPTSGKVISGFSESANRKGIDIAGKLDQPVFASAAGKVVYSGSGLRGYGKLVIIKHNSTYLSAYAHNDQILVKEGQVVTKGQKIAEMGSTDADQVKLHFEIRKFGKPVDPAKYLSL